MMNQLFAKEDQVKRWREAFYSEAKEGEVVSKVTVPKQFLFESKLEEFDGKQIYKHNKNEILKKMQEIVMKFPVLIKPVDGNFHDIFFVFRETALQEALDNSNKCEKLVFQQALNTNTTFKIYRMCFTAKIEERVCMVTDKALQEKYYGDKLINLSKGKAPQIPGADFGPLIDSNLHQKRVEWICDEVSKEYKCWLYGIDIVIDPETGDHCIIDFNAIPSFSAYDDMRTPWMEL